MLDYLQLLELAFQIVNGRIALALGELPSDELSNLDRLPLLELVIEMLADTTGGNLLDEVLRITTWLLVQELLTLADAAELVR